jgi:hypothetical protein
MIHQMQTPGDLSADRPTSEDQAPTSADLGDVAAGPEVGVEGPEAEALVGQALRVALGAMAIAAEAAGAALRRTLPTQPATDEPTSERADPLALLTGAALGLGVSVAEAVARTAGRALRTMKPLAAWTLAPLPLASASGRVTDRLTQLDDRWRKARPSQEEAAAAFARELVPQIVDALLDQIDLTWLVAERVDLDELVARVDVDQIASRLDIDKVLTRVDIDDVASRVDVEALVAKVDLDDVAARIDVDAVAARLDVDAFLERVDLAGLARYVVDEIDLPELIRQSTGTVAAGSVRSARMQGIEADAAVERLVGRVLGRKSQEAISPEAAEPEEGSDQEPPGNAPAS